MKHLTKYKWPVFVALVWTLILGIPVLRYQLHVTILGSPWSGYSVIPNAFWENRFGKEAKSLPIKVGAIIAEKSILGDDDNLQVIDGLDELIAQSPDTAWLLAKRLETVMVIYRGNRQGGELSDVRTYDEIQKGEPSIEKNDNKPNFTPAQMQKTIALCERGETLEPQNAYFSWMKMYFLMMDWQDEKAFAALHAAASKSYWNRHDTEYTKRYVKAAEGILGRALTSYEMGYIGDLELGGGNRTQMRRIIAWQAIKLLRAGTNSKALQLTSDFEHTMTLAMIGENATIHAMIYNTDSIRSIYCLVCE